MTVNAVAYDYENIKITVAGVELDGCTAVSYEDGVEREYAYGAAREPYDQTDGVYTPEDCEVTVKHHTYLNLLEKLGPGYYRKSKKFTVSVVYAHAGETPQTDELVDCTLMHIADDHSQGPDPLEHVLTIKPLKIKRNGREPMNDGAAP